MARDVTLQELLQRAEGNPPVKVAIGMMLFESYSDFVSLVNTATDFALNSMGENPELRQDRSEDELTIELVSLLKQNGIDAGHETKVGGHCDIIVRGRHGYVWLAEAKIHRDYGWLFKGFLQLTTRYATGNAAHDHGALIIYSRQADLKGTMETWKERLRGNVKEIDFVDCAVNPISFISRNTSERTGTPYFVRHIPLSLYWKPRA